MHIQIPERFTRETMYGLLSRTIDNDLQPISNEIHFDFRNLRFIEPTGITILSNLFEWLLVRNVEANIIYPEEFGREKYCPIKYLDDSMFFAEYLGGEPLSEFSHVRPTTLPLQKVSYSSSFQWLQNVFVTWLAGRLYVTRESVDGFRVCLDEIFNNINDHAAEDTGCIFVQQYPRNNEIQIAISDFGVGIPHNVKNSHNPFLNDAEALYQAAQKGFSTKSTPKNRGVGLDNLITSAVLNNKGTVHIHSNNGILKCTNVNNKVEFTPKLAQGFYPGTLIEITLRTDNIENITEEEFSWD